MFNSLQEQMPFQAFVWTDHDDIISHQPVVKLQLPVAFPPKNNGLPTILKAPSQACFNQFVMY